jgi:SAM-dependent methyltransferase
MDLAEGNGTLLNRHPWERARAAFFFRLLRGAVGDARPVRCLDVGCGDAWFASGLTEALAPSSTVTGWDTALDDATIQKLATYRCRALRLTKAAPKAPFDLVVCMDVLEHVEDDASFLGDLVGRYLAPGGLFLCSVPAWPALFSAHDVALKHYRRYTPGACRARLTRAGLQVLRSGGLFHVLLPVRWSQKVLWKLRKDPGERQLGIGGWSGSGLVTSLITAALRAEGRISALAAAAGLTLPGLSWWALCKKP